MFHDEFGEVGENVETTWSLCNGVVLQNGCRFNASSLVELFNKFDNFGVWKVKVVAGCVSVGGEGVGVVVYFECTFVFVQPFFDGSGGLSDVYFGACGAGDGVDAGFLR